MRRNDALIGVCGLPVDGLETRVELGRASELPFAEDSPENGNSTNDGCNNNEHCQPGCLGLCRRRVARDLGSRTFTLHRSVDSSSHSGLGIIDDLVVVVCIRCRCGSRDDIEGSRGQY